MFLFPFVTLPLIFFSIKFDFLPINLIIIWFPKDSTMKFVLISMLSALALISQTESLRIANSNNITSADVYILLDTAWINNNKDVFRI